MLEFNTLEFWAIIVFGYIGCLAITYLVTLKRYNNELKAFEKGLNVEDKHKVLLVFESPKYEVQDEARIISRLEHNLKKNRLIWTKKEKSYCCFYGLVFQARIKCIIKVNYLDTENFKIVYTFYDRFISPVMISYVKKMYEKKMNALYRKIEKGMAEKK